MSSSSSERAARGEHIAREQARVCVELGREEQQAGLWQPFEGAVVLRDGEPYWGHFWCLGIYMPNGAHQAQRAIIGRDHVEALRRNDWLDRWRLTFGITAEGREALGSSVSGSPA